MSDLSRYIELDADAYRTMSGVELARGVARGAYSPRQLAELALTLAREAEPTVNAYVGLREEAALAEAAVLEKEARDGRLRSPLHGVPIASKDNMYLAGEPARKGSRTTDEAPARVSSPFVQRLVDAGTVVIGRTTTPEFGWKGTGISPLTGVTRNPWDPTRNSGGSSAGSGATVGSGAVPIATGSDAGGSVRIPAAFCGTVGLKPTLSAIPVWPGTVNENLSHAGPLTRTVADCRAVLDIARGPDARDPQSAFVRADPAVTGRPLRVGVVRRPFGITPSDEVAARTDVALALLERSGIARFEELDLDTAIPRDIFEGLWVTGRGHGFADLIRAQGDAMDPGLVRLLPLAEEYALPDFLRVVQARRAFNSELFAVFDRVDLLLMPTMPLVAFEADQEVPRGGEAEAKLPWITWTPYTYPFNVSGQPALTVPFDLGDGRLPVGLQVVGAFSADDTVLAFAEAVERVLAPTNELVVAPRR
ncbi:amidase [Microbacterium sp. 18062]|uniref:amidase n=1 Tax=Microbacterium sp. 18062 TaxID=2681410 RepID=UPI00135CC3C1|nr:amidase family protein [Microbacterium sp. 18062]